MLGAYAALIIALSFFHEMWRDEVRAWTVATDTPTWSAMFAELHHEGHPALWYIVLRIGHLLTHSRLVLPVSAILIAIGAAYVILRYSPFPDWLKALAVFGAFLGYELSVSARNYGIGVLCMVAACALYPVRGRKPFGFAIVLALLANTSVHGAIAAVVILGFGFIDWLGRRENVPQSAAAAAIVIAGIAVALISARPSPDMIWATPLSTLDISKILRSILIDPGKGLIGFTDANIAAVSEYPWRLTPISPTLPSRVIVDACLFWLIWNLRSSWKAIVALVIAVLAFEIVFRNLYTGGLRHEGLLLFLILSICWLAVATGGHENVTLRRRVVTGLAPLLVLQALALPVLVNRTISHQQSSSRRFGEFLSRHPQYQNAILVGEPDYLMESMPYYASNRIFMLRQRAFSKRVYFGDSTRRQRDVTLSHLLDTAQLLGCQYNVPVLVAIGARGFPDYRQHTAATAYGGSFSWTAAERARLRSDFRRVAEFPRANTDEVYAVFEAPSCSAMRPA
jgi:hypothetical protein